jgi:acyl dehydratase
MARSGVENSNFELILELVAMARIRQTKNAVNPVHLPARLSRQDEHSMLTVTKEELPNYIGQNLSPSGWLAIDQSMINAFADATLDHQFIHVDEAKAAKTPFGSTIAHGYLTLSLISYFLAECGIGLTGTLMALNYGTDKVRFLQPVKVDSQVRAHAELLEFQEKMPGQILLKTKMTVEIKGEEKPALVAEILSMFITQ